MAKNAILDLKFLRRPDAERMVNQYFTTGDPESGMKHDSPDNTVRFIALDQIGGYSAAMKAIEAFYEPADDRASDRTSTENADSAFGIGAPLPLRSLGDVAKDVIAEVAVRRHPTQREMRDTAARTSGTAEEMQRKLAAEAGMPGPTTQARSSVMRQASRIFLDGGQTDFARRAARLYLEEHGLSETGEPLPTNHTSPL